MQKKKSVPSPSAICAHANALTGWLTMSRPSCSSICPRCPVRIAPLYLHTPSSSRQSSGPKVNRSSEEGNKASSIDRRKARPLKLINIVTPGTCKFAMWLRSSVVLGNQLLSNHQSTASELDKCRDIRE